MHLGEVIKEFRKNHDLSMQAFADKCNVSKGYIAMLEKNINSKTGEPVVPSIETFIKASRAMNIPLNDLIDMVDENQPVNLVSSKSLDIPTNNEDFPIDVSTPLSPEESSLLDEYQKLNTVGRQKAREYIADLADNKKYTENTGSSASAAG